MQFDSRRSVGTHARISVGSERNSGKDEEIDDDSQEQDFAVGAPESPMAVQPKDQPTGKGDHTEDKKRNGKLAKPKKRNDKHVDHIGRSLVMANYVFSGRHT